MQAATEFPLPFAVDGCRGIVVQHRATRQSRVPDSSRPPAVGCGYRREDPREDCASHVHRQDFRVRTDLGWEITCWLEGCEHIVLGQDHHVAVLMAGGCLVQLVNDTTRPHYRLAQVDDFVPPQRVLTNRQIALKVLTLCPLAGLTAGWMAVMIFGPAEGRAFQFDAAVRGWCLLPLACMVAASIGGACQLGRWRRQIVANNRAFRVHAHGTLVRACREQLGVPLRM